MDRSAELRLPTIAVRVRIATVGRDGAEHGELFVADVARTGRSQLFDDLAALLDEPVAFVPVAGRGELRLLGKAAIAWIAARRRDPEAAPATEFPDEPSEVVTLYDHQHRVAIELAHNPPLEGVLLDSGDAAHASVVDHLNRPGRFVRLWTPDDHVLVNKAEIVAVRELAEVP